VDVRVRSGTVVLRGPARAEQIAELVACAARVRGVRAVENRLSLNG
jgi:osmotically-inducible protein OsmY